MHFRKEGGVWEIYENIVSPQELLNKFIGHTDKSSYENIVSYDLLTTPLNISLYQH